MFNAQPVTPLVQAPKAVAFFERASIPTGRKLLLGDRDRLHGSAYNAIGEAHVALENGLKQVTALATDETRRHNPVLQHEAAKKIADRTVTVLERSHATLETRAGELASEAIELVDKAFALPPGRDGIHAEIRAFVRGKAKAEGGLAEIRKVADSDIEFASVLYAAPYYLLDLSKDVHEAIWGDAVKQHIPKAAITLSQSIELEKIAGKYPDTIAKVRASFYSPALANKAASRVEV